jgi:hypothetical protein
MCGLRQRLDRHMPPTSGDPKFRNPVANSTANNPVINQTS